MKKSILFSYLTLFLFISCNTHDNLQVIRVTLPGYLPSQPKIAVWISKGQHRLPDVVVVSEAGVKIPVPRRRITLIKNQWGYAVSARIDFSFLTSPGKWYLSTGRIASPVFRVAPDIYAGAADTLLHYLREQQCGYNPFFNDSCHTRDGFVVFSPNPDLDSVHVDVTGGWHDASDYLRYVTTSATTVLHLLYAWEKFPEVFGDVVGPAGREGADQIPDIINSAKWGLDWLVKMNPAPGVMYHQVADDRDHVGFKLPAEDPAFYGRGKERPVYVATGTPQGSDKYRNHSTGIASVAGKFAAAFAAGARLIKKWYPEYAAMLRQKAIEAYREGEQHPGVCQTAPHLAPYYYAEQNWRDDMETAAMELFLLTGEERYREAAWHYGLQEPVTPWMGADTAEHYQWYPFVNLGHILLADAGGSHADTFAACLRQGLENLGKKAESRPFNTGVPFIWCSNNLTASALLQAYEYRTITGDTTFYPMEAAMAGWLLGNNPWGTSMIIGYPAGTDNPADAHSVVTVQLHRQPLGGLVDGPVYASIFNNLKGIYLDQPDEYAAVQPSGVVYHDDWADYSTNEPTLDGTATLVFYLAALEHKSAKDR